MRWYVDKSRKSIAITLRDVILLQTLCLRGSQRDKSIWYCGVRGTEFTRQQKPADNVV